MPRAQPWLFAGVDSARMNEQVRVMSSGSPSVMRAAVLRDVRSMRIEEVPVPALGPRDVRLRVAAVGLCGTDFHIYEGHGNPARLWDGHSGADVSVLSNIQFKEPVLLTPTGASGSLDDAGHSTVYRRALDLLESGQIRVAPLVTHRYQDLAQVPAAFSGVHRAPDYIKGVVEFTGLHLTDANATSQKPQQTPPAGVLG